MVQFLTPPSFAVIQAVASAAGVELRPIEMRGASEIEQTITAFAGAANGGLIVTASPAAIVHRDLIIALAARHRLPAIYFARFFINAGGLISYGADPIDPHRRAAGYVDRILKGEKPADLPVQQSVKFELGHQSTNRQDAWPRGAADHFSPAPTR